MNGGWADKNVTEILMPLMSSQLVLLRSFITETSRERRRKGAAVWGGRVRGEVMVSGMITAGAEQGHNAGAAATHVGDTHANTGANSKKPNLPTCKNK